MIDKTTSQYIILKPNPFYFPPLPSHIHIKVYFVQDPFTAYRLYETKELDFLPYLPAPFIREYRQKKSFYFHFVLRTDYIGFGKQLGKELRKRLSEALDVKEFQSLFQSPSLIGCWGLPRYFLPKSICISSFHKTKKAFKSSYRPLDFYYSRVGGDDTLKLVQWMQHRWKKNLGITVNLHPVERGMMRWTLLNKKPDLFRKSVPLQVPTCLNAMEIFHSKNPNNYISLKNKDLDRLISKLENSQKTLQKQRLCTKIAKFLAKNYLIYPLGKFYFPILFNGSFSGIHLTPLNQLDLRRIKPCAQKNCHLEVLSP
ncbi:MAG: hypothetical protein D6797_08330 [Bdellovibrio sp.]|nr:MAG: hypothetical protein D6797_08330 [Bdellovibrio sp.]